MNKVSWVAIAYRPAGERAILVDPPQAKALGDQQIASSPARVDVLYNVTTHTLQTFWDDRFTL